MCEQRLLLFITSTSIADVLRNLHCKQILTVSNCFSMQNFPPLKAFKESGTQQINCRSLYCWFILESNISPMCWQDFSALYQDIGLFACALYLSEHAVIHSYPVFHNSNNSSAQQLVVLLLFFIDCHQYSTIIWQSVENQIDFVALNFFVLLVISLMEFLSPRIRTSDPLLRYNMCEH